MRARPRMSPRNALTAVLPLVVALLAPLSAPGEARAQAGCMTFPETGQPLCGRFLAYWSANGGLAINGYPLTPARTETLEDGKQYEVQWFERVRMEYHPENADPRFQVLLGQFGRAIHPADPPVAPKTGARFFPETGHNMGGDFLAYWTANGGLAQFGYPLSEEIEETLEGRVRTVQYTERARFERHPENQPPFNVLLGQFGRQLLTRGVAQPPAMAVPPPAATPSFNGTPYRDQFSRFTARHPMGWSVRVDGDRNVNFLSPQNPPAAGINVSPRPVTANVTLDEYRRNDYEYLVPRLRDYRQISDTPFNVGPYTGFKRVYTITNDENQFEMIVRYHFRAPGYVVVVNCFAAPENEPLYMPLFDGTTRTIEVLPT